MNNMSTYSNNIEINGYKSQIIDLFNSLDCKTTNNLITYISKETLDRMGFLGKKFFGYINGGGRASLTADYKYDFEYMRGIDKKKFILLKDIFLKISEKEAKYILSEYLKQNCSNISLQHIPLKVNKLYAFFIQNDENKEITKTTRKFINYILIGNGHKTTKCPPTGF